MLAHDIYDMSLLQYENEVLALADTDTGKGEQY